MSAVGVEKPRQRSNWTKPWDGLKSVVQESPWLVEGHIALGEMVTNCIQRAKPELAVDAESRGYAFRDVITIDSVIAIRLEFSRGKKLDQAMAEQNIRIGREDKRSLGVPKPHILCHVLKYGHAVGVGEAAVHFIRNFDDADSVQHPRVRPADRLPQARPVSRRVPLDDDKLSVQTAFLPHREQGVHKHLQAAQEIPAVIVVSRRNHKAKIRLHRFRLSGS